MKGGAFSCGATTLGGRHPCSSQQDSPLERDGFEPLVPLRKGTASSETTLIDLRLLLLPEDQATPSQGRPGLSRVGNGGMSVASRPVLDLCAGTVCDGGVSVPVRTLDRCAAVVFVGGMSVAVRTFARGAGTACAGGVSVAAGAADPNTGTFSVDETLLHGSIVRRR